MNKLFTKIATAALGFALAIGAGISAFTTSAAPVKAEEETVATLVFNATNNSGKISSYSNSWTNTTNGFKWTLKNLNNNNNQWSYVRAGSKNAASVASIATSAAVPEAITRVSIVVNKITAGSVNSFTLKSGSTVVGNFNKATGTQSVTIPTPATNQTYTITIDCAKGSGNGFVEIAGVTLYAEPVSAESVVTEMSVTPSTWTGTTTDTLNVSDFDVSVTKDGAEGTAADYAFQGIGTGTGDDFVARKENFTIGRPLATDTTLQWKSVYPTTVGGEEYLYATVALNVVVDTVTSIEVSGTMTQTNYSTNEPWNPSGLTVTATYLSGNTEDVTSLVSWTYSAETVVETTSVVATATYEYEGKEVSADSDPINVTVTFGAMYDFVSKFSTYASAWNTSYTARTITSANVGCSTDATVKLTYANKQEQTITDRPVIGAKSGNTSTLTFTLGAGVAANVLISEVEVTFAQWTTKTMSGSLYAGTSASGTALASSTTLGTTKVLSADEVNNRSFIINFTTSSTSNVQLGLTSIRISLKTLGEDIDTAEEFAQTFLDSVSCDATGATGPTFTTYSWDVLSGIFLALSDEDQDLINGATGAEGGSVIEECVAKYDYILAKYGTTKYSNFMGREVTGVTSYNPIFEVANSDATVNVITIIALVSVAGIGFALLGKKRNQLSK